MAVSRGIVAPAKQTNWKGGGGVGVGRASRRGGRGGPRRRAPRAAARGGRLKVWEGFGGWSDDEVKLSGEGFERIVTAAVPPETASLKAPPRIRSPSRRRGEEGGQVGLSSDHLKPHVFSVVGVPAEDAETKLEQTLLFLYSQGTESWSGSDSKGLFMSVTACLVGRDQFAVSHNASGVYMCVVTRGLEMGERLSLVVAPTVWKKQPALAEKQQILAYMVAFEQLEDGSFVLGSDVIWEDQMERRMEQGDGRYSLCLMTQEKTFPEYIPEWLAYHRRIGVDYVYIYDNGAAGNLSHTYVHAADVEVVRWPWPRSQIQAQNHFLLVGRLRCQWALLIDVDEYLMVMPRRTDRAELALKRYLRVMREAHDFSQIRLTSVALGSSGNVYRPRAPLAESYWHYANIQDDLTKPLVWVGHTLPDSYVHHVTMAQGYYTKTTASALKRPEQAEIALCHMKYRSWEDYVLKGRGGRNSFHVGAWGFSSDWSIHAPKDNHMSLRNVGAWTEFRNRWKRLMLYKVRAPVLKPLHEAELRYKRVKRDGYAWKRRRMLGNSTLETNLVEQEKYFRELRDWEVAKRDRLATMNIAVDF